MPISSPKLPPFPWESYGNPMRIGIPIPVHTSKLNMFYNDTKYRIGAPTTPRRERKFTRTYATTGHSAQLSLRYCIV